MLLELIKCKRKHGYQTLKSCTVPPGGQNILLIFFYLLFFGFLFAVSVVLNVYRIGKCKHFGAHLYHLEKGDQSLDASSFFSSLNIVLKIMVNHSGVKIYIQECVNGSENCIKRI